MTPLKPIHSSASRRNARPTPPRRGFALLVTIVLVAFLVLVLVGLASFTRVETQIATNNTRLAQARSNALFGLGLALGQLQRHAGPDQRVTARADIDSANSGNPLWTGVWDATPPDAAVPTHAAAPTSPSPLTWLVSGNETNGVAITPVASPVTSPDESDDTVWLVRRALGHDLPDALRVRLNKTPINVAAEQIPGADASSGPVRSGSYAWWVSDEGVKAKINVGDPYRTENADSPEAAWRREAAPRPGLDLLDHEALATAFATTTDALETARARVLSYEQLPMLHAALAATDGLEQAALSVHDLTTVGQGVLADTLRGGLRRDLTRGLAAAPATGSLAATEIGNDVAVFNLPPPGGFGRTARLPTSSIWTPSREPHAPTWSQVRAWSSSRVPASNAMNPIAAPLVNATRNGITVPTTAGHAIMPVVVTLELGYGLDIGPDGEYRVMVRPRVVLMNPYNVALNHASYCVIYQSFISSNSELRFSLAPVSPLTGTAVPPLEFLLTGNNGLIEPNPSNGIRQLLFNITDNFAPGEVRVYSLPASATEDIQVNNGLFNLEAGLTTTRGYLKTNTPAPDWYDPARRNQMRVTWTRIPVDAPRISIALGTASLSSVPVPSMTARHIQTNSSVIYGLSGGRPDPVALLDSDSARQMRTIRFVLRHAEFDLVTHANGNMASEGEIGGGLSADTTSGARFLVDGNPRAILSQRIGGRDAVAHYAMLSFKGGEYVDLDHDGENAFWGGSVEDNGFGASRVALFDLPRENEEIVSLGRLAQVNWGVDGKHPAYPLGNSFASIFYPHNSPDYGHALNEALWDRFFLSTLPSSLASAPANLPNSRLRFISPEDTVAHPALEGAEAYQLAASRLLIDGAFNINSTSVEAWAAFLGSVQEAGYAYQTGSGSRTDAGVRPFPRLRNLHSQDPTASAGNMYEWNGYRHLGREQLRALASGIVDGIKARGRPARSLAEFINRDLSLAATAPANQAGIVQRAINAAVNTDAPGSGGASLADLDGLNPSLTVSQTFSLGDNPDAARGKLRSAGAPGFLLQSDLLTPLAPAMSARSDTFRIRVFGEARNPVTGEIESRAWCEAIVQRLPDYVGGEAAELRPDDPALGPASRDFGRKFTVTRFRWLGPEDI